jgi:hypothetical protein
MMAGKIFDGFADIDTLAQPALVEVNASNLKAGMVLVDPELGTPAMGIDHKLRSTRNSGNVEFLVADLENGGWRNLSLFSNTVVSVIA